jgi:topoisomerase-4 subunit A
MIGRDGRPKQKTLLDIVQEWVAFRVETVRRRTLFRLDKVNDRIHILEGRQLVLLNIDEVIRIIRHSDEPKPALMDAFELSDRQAEDILEIRLRQLARLEAIRIERELKELREEKDGLQALLDSETALRRLIVKEIEGDAKQYGDDRRTLIEQAQRASVEVKLIEEPVTVIVSDKGWVRARQGHGHDPAQFTFKSGDAFYGAYPVMTSDMLYAIATNGRVYSIAVAALPSARGDGVPITSLVDVESGARIEHAFAAAADTSLLLATAGGNGLVCQVGDWASRMKAGKSFMSLEAGDKPIRPALFIASVGTTVVCLSDGSGGGHRGRLLAFDIGDVKVLKNGGRGVTLMNLDPKETLRQVIVCGRNGLVITGNGNRDKPMERTMSAREIATYAGTRGRKGKLLEPKWKDVLMTLPPA